MNTKGKTMDDLLFEIECLKQKAIKSEKINESIVETATDAIITIDAHGVILSWNRAAQTIFGYKSSEIINKSIFNIISKKSTYEIEEDDLNRFLKTGLKRKLGQTIEILGKKKSNEEFQTELSISKWKLNGISYYTGIFRDITERKKKDFILRKLDLAIKNSKDIVIMTDTNGVITFVNPQFTKAYGYEPGEVLGKHTPRILKAEENKERFESLWKALLSKKSFKMAHYQNKKKDGSLIDLESTIDPILNDNGDVIGFLGIQHDITKRISYIEKLKEAIEKTKESERLKSEFLATMSHELRTPLNSIIGLSSLIDNNSPLHEILEYNKIINNSGEHLLKLIEDLFDISLIESGKSKAFMKEINLNTFLNEIYELMKAHQIQLGKNHINFNLEIPSDCKNLTIVTDELKLKHILINLIKNAFKFSEKGTISYGFEINEKDTNNSIEFFVSDTGIGIDESNQDLIFKGFTQVNGSYNRNYEGIGVGLTITKKLVNLLKGNIWLNSKIDKGSTFFFSLPFDKINSKNNNDS